MAFTPPFYATQIVNPFLNSRISPDYVERLSANHYKGYCFSIVESLLLNYNINEWNLKLKWVSFKNMLDIFDSDLFFVD